MTGPGPSSAARATGNSVPEVGLFHGRAKGVVW
jgi:hypothetical protein